MGIGTPGPHFGCNPDSFHQFFRRCPRAQRRLGVTVDAVGALRHVGDRDRDDLLDLCGKSPIGEDRFAECIKGGLLAWCQAPPLLRHFVGRRRIHLSHRSTPLDCLGHPRPNTVAMSLYQRAVRDLQIDPGEFHLSGQNRNILTQRPLCVRKRHPAIILVCSRSSDYQATFFFYLPAYGKSRTPCGRSAA